VIPPQSAQSGAIRRPGIAEIAKIENRNAKPKAKTSPLINTDDTDQKSVDLVIAPQESPESRASGQAKTLTTKDTRSTPLS